MNRAAIDRGLFRSSFYRTYTEHIQTNKLSELTTSQEVFERPNTDECVAMRHGSYAKLELDGLVSPGTRVSGTDIIIGKTVPLRSQQSSQVSKRDSSRAMRPNESGFIDQASPQRSDTFTGTHEALSRHRLYCRQTTMA